MLISFKVFWYSSYKLNSNHRFCSARTTAAAVNSWAFGLEDRSQRWEFRPVLPHTSSVLGRPSLGWERNYHPPHTEGHRPLVEQGPSGLSRMHRSPCSCLEVQSTGHCQEQSTHDHIHWSSTSCLLRSSNHYCTALHIHQIH